MTTARQMAANLRNAQRSTGPRTAAGKSTSSRNALRHGLSRPQEMNAATEADIYQLTNEIVGNCDNNYQLRHATEAATALLDLIRIQKVRTEMLAAMKNLAKATPDELQRLLALHRYESRARTRRRRASAQLERNG
jgi:hypothetical protein